MENGECPLTCSETGTWNTNGKLLVNKFFQLRWLFSYNSRLYMIRGIIYASPRGCMKVNVFFYG